ncbi:MAG: thioesterase family protein [Clostridia bacterium]|nr:thioesterase family protein [Clostridia bacterium]
MSNLNLQLGLTASIETTVTKKDTAAEVGSGSVDVYATPIMICLMEKVAASSVEHHLPEGFATVGTLIDVKHLAATPVGMKVRAVAELVKLEERLLGFKVEAFDEVDKIGEGYHERFIINVEKFQKKAKEKSKL